MKVGSRNSNSSNNSSTADKAESESAANDPEKDKEKPENKKDEDHKKKSTVCSYWFQIIENHVVYIVAEHLINCGILKPNCYGLEYDGLNIPPFKDFDKEKTIKEVNDLVLLTTGLDIRFKFKDYDDTNILHDIIETRRNMVIEDAVDDVTDEVSSINPLDWTLDNQALVMKTAL